MDKESAKKRMCNLIDIYPDEEWEFQVSWFSLTDLLEVRMYKPKR